MRPRTSSGILKASAAPSARMTGESFAVSSRDGRSRKRSPAEKVGEQVNREGKTMQDTESVKTLSTERKQLSRSSGRRGETDADAGTSEKISLNIAVLPGDGIGPEVIGAALAVLKTLEGK